MIEQKEDKEESEDEDEEEEEEEDDDENESKDKKEKEKDDKKTKDKKSKNSDNKSNLNENNKEELSINKTHTSKNSKSKKEEEKSNKESKNKTSKEKTIRTKEKEQNINDKYTEEDIIKNAGFKIDKSSKKSKELDEDIENNKEPEKKEIRIEDKLIPDPKEIRDLHIHAAKIRNEFPKWSKVPEAKGGDLAVKCWNCGNINICNSKFSVIQCPVCHEMNKVPKIMDRIDELLMLAKANTCTSYADINHTVPLVNYIVVCPYCKCDNKVRETACFCICYMCKNKWTIKRPDAPELQEEKKKKPPKQRGLEGNYYKYDAKTGRILPPDKPMRFSDLFYPDPMFYPGYYPINSLSPLYPEYFTPYDDYRYIDRQEKTIKYFDRINQQRKLMEQFGNILDDKDNNNNMTNNNINLNSQQKYEKPYYHLNYENNIEKKDILRQLEDLDRKSENLMKNRIFPNQEVKSTYNSIKTIKSRYNDNNKETSSLYEKTSTSKKISSMGAEPKKSQQIKINNNISLEKNNIDDEKSKSNSKISNDKSENRSISKFTKKRSSMDDISGKHKSIESTYFMKE